MDINEIYRLMDRFETSALAELELELVGVKVSMRKAVAATGTATAAAVPTVQAIPPVPVTVSASEVSADTAVETASDQTDIWIKAPLVGTFYRSPAPGEAPYVAEGQKIKKGDVIGIIEAMKLMNEITAPADGTVLAVEAEDGAMVEYNEILVRVKPA